MTFLYAVTLFVAAFLLFWIEPLIAKMLLPMMGGTPTVWNACSAIVDVGAIPGTTLVSRTAAGRPEERLRPRWAAGTMAGIMA